MNLHKWASPTSERNDCLAELLLPFRKFSSAIDDSFLNFIGPSFDDLRTSWHQMNWRDQSNRTDWWKFIDKHLFHVSFDTLHHRGLQQSIMKIHDWEGHEDVRWRFCEEHEWPVMSFVKREVTMITSLATVDISLIARYITRRSINYIERSSRWRESRSFVRSFSSHVFWLKEFCHGEKGFRRFGLTELFSLKQWSFNGDEQHRDGRLSLDWSCRWSSWGFEYIFTHSPWCFIEGPRLERTGSMFSRTWTWRSSLHYFVKHRCLC